MLGIDYLFTGDLLESLVDDAGRPTRTALSIRSQAGRSKASSHEIA